jgi:hypothetical protein
VVSLFVNATTSPTLAVIVAGSNAKLAIFTATVPASVDGAHAAPPPAAGEPPAAADSAADSAGALAAGALAAVVALELPLQAATMNNVAVPSTRISRVDIAVASSRYSVRVSSRGIEVRYDAAGRAVS